MTLTRIVAAVFAALALASLTGCGGTSAGSADDGDTITGRLTAPRCGGGYDIELEQVVLRNESEDIIATGDTSANLLEPLGTPCVVDFTLKDVPEAEFYTVEIGTHSGPAYSRADLAEQGFATELTLGGATMPSASTADLCDSLEKLQDLLLDTDLLNEDHKSWDAQLAALREDVDAYAASQLLADERESGVDAAAFGDLLRPLDYDAWQNIKELNRAVKPVNTEAAALSVSSGCDELWSPVTYN